MPPQDGVEKRVHVAKIQWHSLKEKTPCTAVNKGLVFSLQEYKTISDLITLKRCVTLNNFFPNASLYSLNDLRIYIHIYIYIYIYIYTWRNIMVDTHVMLISSNDVSTSVFDITKCKQTKLDNYAVVESDPKTSFTVAATPRRRRRCYSFPWTASLNLEPYLIMLSVKQRQILKETRVQS